MAQIPANIKQWDMLVAQAKTKFDKWPSPTASNWVHRQYVQLGGKFVESTSELNRQQRKDRAESEKRKDERRRAGLK